MSRIRQIQRLIEEGLWYLTEHAMEEMEDEEFNMSDIEHALLNGHIRRSWPREQKHEITGPSRDNRPMGVVCRVTSGGKVRVITAYEDRPKKGA